MTATVDTERLWRKKKITTMSTKDTKVHKEEQKLL
jgi:hypothetical protein